MATTVPRPEEVMAFGCHVSVLMPAYNEADNLAELIPQVGRPR